MMLRPSIVKAILLCILLQPIGPLHAQVRAGGTLRGRVIDGETSLPIADANVFLSSTTLGTTSSKDGEFSLRNVPEGEYDLVASLVGYERKVVTVRVVGSDTLLFDIRLSPRLLQAGQVEVTSEVPAAWDENLARFTRAFLGETAHAAECRIVNPEVLDLAYDDGADELVARSESLLVVENRAIGYVLTIQLVSFRWNVGGDYGNYIIYTQFREMRPRDDRQRAEWETNRNDAFVGSLRQFLRSLYHGESADASFTMFSGKLKMLQKGFGHQVSSEDLRPSAEEGTTLKRIEFPEYLRVECPGATFGLDGDGQPVKRALVSFIARKGDYALVDSTGNLLNPLSLEISGEWARHRVAEFLPLH
jgi:hypothetical protein